MYQGFKSCVYWRGLKKLFTCRQQLHPEITYRNVSGDGVEQAKRIIAISERNIIAMRDLDFHTC